MFVGMDIHKNYLQIVIMDNKGKLMRNDRIDNNRDEINRFFSNNDVEQKNSQLVMESSCTWYSVYQYLAGEKHLDIVLSNPVKTRAIASAKIKTDKVDAVKLADLLRGGYISECYVPDKRIMELRELVRHREVLVKIRTKMKNKIHGIMLMKGIKISNIGTHTFTKKYNEQLKELHNYRIDAYLRLIDSLEKEIKDVSNEILLQTKQDGMAKLLMTIPGIGFYSALLIVSEIGDISRFPDSNHLCSYAGLVPSSTVLVE